jgi:hypothetical protein
MWRFILSFLGGDTVLCWNGSREYSSLFILNTETDKFSEAFASHPITTQCHHQETEVDVYRHNIQTKANQNQKVSLILQYENIVSN